MRVLQRGSTGDDVKELQRALRARSKPRGMPLVAVDGELGNETFVATRRVGRALGCLEETLQGPDVTVGLQRMILTPALRTPVQLARAASRARQAKVQEARAKAARPVVSGNKVTGGRGGRDRLVAGARAALAADMAGVRKSFYSQLGVWNCQHTITGEAPGERSDCSEFETGLHFSCGLHDPSANNFRGGYTGSMAEHMHEVSWAECDDGDTVIWDPWGPQGHTATVEDKKRGLCIGHGSAHVARHSISDFNYKGRARFFRGSST